MKRFLTVALATIGLLTSVSFSACEDKEKSTPAKKSLTTTLVDFEEWAPDFQNIRMLTGFGVITRNSDEKYVKSGKYSAKLQPMGQYSTGKIPEVYFRTYSDVFNYDYSDFSQVERISASFYNAEEYVQTVEMGIVSGVKNYEYIDVAGLTKFNLQPGWNTIDCWLDHDALTMAEGVNMKDVAGVYFRFENAHVREAENAPVLYLDDIQIHKAKTLIDLKYTIELDENEIGDFEKEYQSIVLRTQCTKEKAKPTLEVVNANSYGLQAPSGENILRVTAKAGDEAGAEWIGFYFAENVMELTGIKDIPESEWETTYLSYFAYNNTNAPWIVNPTFFAVDGQNGKTKGVTLNPKEWQEVKVSLAWLVEPYTDDETATEARSRVLNIGRLRVTWAEFIGEDREIFFDNFRVVRASENQ